MKNVPIYVIPNPVIPYGNRLLYHPSSGLYAVLRPLCSRARRAEIVFKNRYLPIFEIPPAAGLRVLRVSAVK